MMVNDPNLTYIAEFVYVVCGHTLLYLVQWEFQYISLSNKCNSVLCISSSTAGGNVLYGLL